MYKTSLSFLNGYMHTWCKYIHAKECRSPAQSFDIPPQCLEASFWKQNNYAFCRPIHLHSCDCPQWLNFISPPHPPTFPASYLTKEDYYPLLLCSASLNFKIPVLCCILSEPGKANQLTPAKVIPPRCICIVTVNFSQRVTDFRASVAES